MIKVLSFWYSIIVLRFFKDNHLERCTLKLRKNESHLTFNETCYKNDLYKYQICSNTYNLLKFNIFISFCLKLMHTSNYRCCVSLYFFFDLKTLLMKNIMMNEYLFYSTVTGLMPGHQKSNLVLYRGFLIFRALTPLAFPCIQSVLNAGRII